MPPEFDPDRAGAAGSSRLDPARIRRALRSGALSSAEPMARSNQGWLFGLRFDGRDLVVKTPAGGAFSLVHRRALAREFRAYRRLEGLPGFATCHGLFDDRWLVLDRIRGTGFRDRETGPEFFARLLDVVRSMHERGVAHGDLKRKSNLMIDDSGSPIVLDLGTALVHRPGMHPVNHALFRFLVQTDLNAWIKLKYGGYENIEPADAVLLRRSRIEQLLARVRRA